VTREPNVGHLSGWQRYARTGSPDRMQDVRLRRFLFSQSGRTVGAIDLHFLRNDDVVMQQPATSGSRTSTFSAVQGSRDTWIETQRTRYGTSDSTNPSQPRSLHTHLRKISADQERLLSWRGGSLGLWRNREESRSVVSLGRDVRPSPS